MATAELTNGAPIPRDAARWSLWIVCVFAVSAIACHALISTEAVVAGEALGVQAPGVRPDTGVFAGVGGMFVFLTVLSHIPVVRAMSRQGATQPDGGEAARPVTALLLSMGIRLLGTFMVLAGLLASHLVGRNEAVFDVLFWYVTLTTIEVVGIVWASKSFAKSASAKFGPATKGV